MDLLNIKSAEVVCTFLSNVDINRIFENLILRRIFGFKREKVKTIYF
jgi:hypothetical protein